MQTVTARVQQVKSLQVNLEIMMQIKAFTSLDRFCNADGREIEKFLSKTYSFSLLIAGFPPRLGPMKLTGK